MKILVVEDEEKIARSLEKGLKGEGYIVDVAFDGDQAESLTVSNSYDLVLLDWASPYKNMAGRQRTDANIDANS
jgi:DNA-binding response OmpR family regulator